MSQYYKDKFPGAFAHLPRSFADIKLYEDETGYLCYEDRSGREFIFLNGIWQRLHDEIYFIK